MPDDRRYLGHWHTVDSWRRGAIGICLLFILSCAAYRAAEGQGQPAITYMHRYLPTAEPELDSEDTVGFQTCANCHKSEYGVWTNTWHHTSYRRLHRSNEAQQIAAKLSLSSVKYSARCVRCHYTETESDGQLFVDAAVSCESCHGAGKNWYSNHFPVGGSSLSETLTQKDTRVGQNIKNGMRNRHNVYTMSRICMRCHNMDDEELVNVGGHPYVNVSFEMVRCSQGRMRHRFVSGRGNGNQPNSAERLRVMYVSGQIADLEFSLRGTANATQKAEFGVQAAKRARSAGKRLVQIQQRIQQPLLAEIIAEYQQVKLSINNQADLTQAADRIQVLGIRFAAEVSGAELEAIQELVPKPAQWVWK